MDEKIKKEIEELEKDFKKEEKETSEEVNFQRESTIRFIFPNFIVLSGIVACLIFILLGLVFFYYKFFTGKTIPLENSTFKEKTETLESKANVENQTTNQAVSYFKEKVKFSTSQINYPYKLELKNFLISVDNKNFLKLDVTLYFEKDSEFKGAVDNELLYRDFIFKFLEKIETKNWKNEVYVKDLEKRLIYEMRKKGITPLPQAVELDGVLLKA